MNMSYDTIARLATAGAVLSCLVFWATGLILARTAHRAVMAWMRRKGKPYSEEVWFNRCVLVYLFLSLFVMDGLKLSMVSEVLAWGLLFEIALNNPWMVRCVEQHRKETAHEQRRD